MSWWTVPFQAMSDRSGADAGAVAGHETAFELRPAVELAHDVGEAVGQVDVERAEAAERLEVHDRGDPRRTGCELHGPVVRFGRDVTEQHAGRGRAAGNDLALCEIVGRRREVSRRHDADLASVGDHPTTHA